MKLWNQVADDGLTEQKGCILGAFPWKGGYGGVGSSDFAM